MRETHPMEQAPALDESRFADLSLTALADPSVERRLMDAAEAGPGRLELAPGAIGTDTGGSIRIPAALCGLAGIKPTYGRVSRRGVFPLAWSLDHCGPLSKSVEDSAIALQILAGHDPYDDASADVPVPDYTASLAGGARGLRLGIPRQHFFQMLDDEVLGAVKKALSAWPTNTRSPAT